MEKKFKYLGLITLVFIALLVGCVLWWMHVLEQRTEIVFLNIGQGDAILISQGANQIIIDGGRNGKDLLSRLGRHMPFWDRKIEIVIATHPDMDHIGGFPALLRAYRVDQVLYTGDTSETETFELLEQAIEEQVKKEPLKIFRGTTLKLPRGGELYVEYPFTPLSENMTEIDTNEGSIVSRFTFGETSFLLTGDLSNEETVLPETKEVTVLKVAHHGSKYSTSDTFLALVRPKEAVISVGKNSYGHPAQEVLERLSRVKALVHRTDERGDIVYRCLPKENRCAYVQ